MKQYVNDAIELLQQLIATPSVSRDEGAAADVMETVEPDGIAEAAEAVTEAAAESASAEVEAETAPVVEAAVEELSEEVTKTGTEAVAAPKKKTKKTTIGGQALIEGIMMCGPRRTAIAVRKADGSIYVEEIKRAPARRSLKKCRSSAAVSVSSVSSSPEPRRS